MKDNNNSLAVPNLHIPPEAVEAAARAIATMEGAPEAWVLRQVRATAAIRAMLAAWPGVTGVHASPISPAVLILPLTEKTDD